MLALSRYVLAAAASLAAMSLAADPALAAACSGVTFGTGYSSSYACNSLGGVPGVTTPYGGVAFLNANTLLVGGNAASGAGSIDAITVTRGAGGHITGFSGPATFFASAPGIDGGLSFGPGGVLFYTDTVANGVGQLKPGSIAPDKLVGLPPSA